MADPKARVILEAVRKGDRAFQSFTRDIDEIAKKAAVVATAATAAMAAITRESFKTIDANAKVAQKLGLTTESLAALQVQAGLTGVENRQLELGLQRMTRRIAEIAEKGTGTATPALEQLGLTIEELEGLSPDQQFEKIAMSMQGMTDQGAKVLAAFGLFDSEGVNLVRTLDAVGGGLDEARELADRLGVSVSAIDSAKIEAANDALFLARQRVRGLGNAFAVEVAPIIESLTNRFLEAGGGAQQMAEIARSAIDGIALSIGIVADAFHGWKLIFATVEAGFASLVLKIEQARAFLNSFQGDTERIQQNLEAAFDIQINAASSEQIKENLRQARDIQLESLDIETNNERLRVAEESSRLAREKLDSLRDATKPSEIIAANLQQARIDAEAAARAIVDTAPAAAVPHETAAESDAREAAEREAERQRELLEQQLENVREYTLTREEIEIEAITRRLEVLRTSREQDLIDQQRFEELSIEVARRGQQALTDIAIDGMSEREAFEAQSAQSRVQHVLGALTAMTAGVAQTNKALFNVNKAAAIANAIVSTHAGVTKALEAYPPPLSFIMAAAQAAAGAAQIQAIKSTSFGGGTTPSLAGSAGVVGGQPVQQLAPIAPPERDSARSAPNVSIYIQAPIYGMDDRETAEHFANRIRDLVADNELEILPPDSLNAQRVRSG